MKTALITLSILSSFAYVNALVISEVMSNPTGDDSGREWIEVYNETSSPIDLVSMTVSIKGATAVTTTPLQGGTTLAPGAYAIIGSVVSGATKFLQDYPTYTEPLFRSSVSLVNTGVTSIDIKLQGSTVASLSSYTAAKEGYTLSLVAGAYVLSDPTPGYSNQAAESSSSSNTQATTTENQVVVPQVTPPLSNIVMYLPEQKVVVAGAESEFSAFSMTREGKPISDLRYMWAFGDGGQGTGSSTKHRYVYSGRYLAQVEAQNATTVGTGRMIVRVVAPDISISGFGGGKYGSYVDIINDNDYDLDFSQWMLTLDGVPYVFPKNTILLANQITRFSGASMGFASTTLSTSTLMRIIFPNLEEVTRYIPQQRDEVLALKSTTTLPLTSISITPPKKVVVKAAPKPVVLGVSTTTSKLPTSVTPSAPASPSAPKDTRIMSWFRSLIN